jgi:hypothetical protein
MADVSALLAALADATAGFRQREAEREQARKLVVARALEALRGGAEPGDVYDRSPFTSTQMRTLAREAGVPPGKPGIKRRAKPDHDDTDSA